MRVNGVNAEQEALLEQIRLPDNTFKEEVIRTLESIDIEARDIFEEIEIKDMINSTISFFK